MKKLAILGSTGSIGQNTLFVAKNHDHLFQIKALTTHKNIEKLYEQALQFKPTMIGISGAVPTEQQKSDFHALGIDVVVGDDAPGVVALEASYDMLVNSVVGAAGFLPTLRAIERGKTIALANKETLVMAGEMVMQKAKKHNTMILPIDSEHSAIFQCLMGENGTEIEKIILTASGGPFRDLPADQFRKVTVEQALNHPNWNMGKKITIDSATMMNKGLEVIEAHWLFGMDPNQIDVLIHPQSIIHSMVLFSDGSYKAQLGQPDMRVPIQLALTFPERLKGPYPRLDFDVQNKLTFEKPDLKKFRCLALAFQSCKTGGIAPAVMNAANETAVSHFLNRTIRFDQIAGLIENALNDCRMKSNPDIEQLIDADHWARDYVNSKVN
jgi:1-deoxy-D-xylulose-5-phosphate reductoisomerase